MTIDELKAKVEEKRQHFATKGGKGVSWGSNGPVGIDMIDMLVKAMEAQAKRIAELEKRGSN